jgi:arylsulfatase A-like enzyme
MMDYWRHYNDGCNGGPCNGLDLHENSAGGTGVSDTDVYNTVGDYSSEMFARRAATLIAQHGFLGTDGQSPPPFFLYLAFQNGHSGNNKYLQAPDYYFSLDDINDISPDNTCGQYQVTGDCIHDDPGHGAASRKSSAAQIRALDDGIKDVVSALKRASMWDNTLLVFSSDNGGPTDGGDNNMNNNFPLRGCKGGYFDGGLRVPALVSGGIFSGIMDSARGVVVYNGYHHATDWLPTLLTAAKRGATGDLKAYHGNITLKSSEREFLPGDGLDNWDFISTGGMDHAKPSARTEIAHAVQVCI